MKKGPVILIIVAVLILSVGLYLKMHKVDVKNYPLIRYGTIIAFGDSLIEGVGSTKGNDLASLLSRGIGEEVINEGRSGDTTITALSRVNDVLELDPKIVILLLGGNDYLKHVPKEETFQNLEDMITIFQNKGAIVVLLGVRGGALKDNYDSDFEDLSRRMGTFYISNVLDGLLGKKEYMYDTVHPNDAGYKMISERVLPILKDILKK